MKPSGKETPLDSSAEFEDLLKKAGGDQHYVLRLYVTGSTPRSAKAITTIHALCEEHLKGRYDLKVVDIYQQPDDAKNEQIIAAPTLVKSEPFPPKRLIGDLSDRDKVLVGLDLALAEPDSDTKWMKF